MLGSEPRLSYIWHASSQVLELSIYPNQIQCVHIDQYSHSVVYRDFAIRFLYSPLNVFPSLSAFSIFFLQMISCIGSLKISFPWWLIFEKFLLYFIIFIVKVDYSPILISKFFYGLFHFPSFRIVHLRFLSFVFAVSSFIIIKENLKLYIVIILHSGHWTRKDSNLTLRLAGLLLPQVELFL